MCGMRPPLKPTAPLYAILMREHILFGGYGFRQALRLFARMKREGTAPTRAIFTLLIDGALRCGEDYEQAQALMSEMRRGGMEPEEVSILLSHEARSMKHEA